MKTSPFKRAIALFALVQSAMGDVSKLAAIPEYRSRGKGRGLHSGKKWSTSSNRNMAKVNGKWRQIENGARECERRMRQNADKDFYYSPAIGANVVIL